MLSSYLKRLCLPSKVFLALSLFSFTVMVLQNINGSSEYCVGRYSCRTNKYMIFMVKFLYILCLFFMIILSKLTYRRISI